MIRIKSHASRIRKLSVMHWSSWRPSFAHRIKTKASNRLMKETKKKNTLYQGHLCATVWKNRIILAPFIGSKWTFKWNFLVHTWRMLHQNATTRRWYSYFRSNGAHFQHEIVCHKVWFEHNKSSYILNSKGLLFIIENVKKWYHQSVLNTMNTNRIATGGGGGLKC